MRHILCWRSRHACIYMKNILRRAIYHCDRWSINQYTHETGLCARCYTPADATIILSPSSLCRSSGKKKSLQVAKHLRVALPYPRLKYISVYDGKSARARALKGREYKARILIGVLARVARFFALERSGGVGRRKKKLAENSFKTKIFLSRGNNAW